ncbi:hypothetical protein MIDIC_110033 [Alphaproteobacteria bacterium]
MRVLSRIVIVEQDCILLCKAIDCSVSFYFPAMWSCWNMVSRLKLLCLGNLWL